MRQLWAAIVFVLLCVYPARADFMPATQPVQLTTEAPIVADDNCLVQRYRIDIAKGTPVGFITSEMGGKDGGSCLYPSAVDQPQSVVVTVTAMVGWRQCMFHMSYAMVTATQAFKVANNAKVKDVIHLDAESGPHALEEKIRLGDYNGQPLFVTISPKAYWKANPQGP